MNKHPGIIAASGLKEMVDSWEAFMFRKSWLLVLLLLAVLAACSQAPAPEADVSPELGTLKFGTPGRDEARSLVGHSTGVYVVGGTNGNLHGTSKGSSDAFIRKYNTTGAVLWGKQFGTADADHALGVASDSNNNAYVVGYTTGSLAGSKGGFDAFIRKYNSSGSVAWTKQFGTSSVDFAPGVAVFGSNIYVVGYTDGSLAGSKGSNDAFIRKYDASGNIKWTKQFGTSSSDGANDVAVDSSGNIYVAGYTSGSLEGTNGGGWDMFLRKYSPSGSVLWTKQLHYSDRDYASAVTVSGSNVYLVGNYLYQDKPDDAEVRVVKYTTAGEVVWDYSYGYPGHEYVSDASADSNGNLYFAGETETSFAGTNQGDYDGYIIKLNPNGLYGWRKVIGTAQYDSTTAVLARGTAQVYGAGYTYGALGGTNSGYYDAYLRRLKSSNGATVWTDQ